MMKAFVRPARHEDLDSLYEMAKLAGSGFTNLPADRAALAAKLAESETAFTRCDDAPHDDRYMLMLEDADNGRVAGTAQVMARIGDKQPFYSYRRGTLTQHSNQLGRSFRAETLTLTTDLEGSSEVGGLFLHPRYRAGGLGLLLARSRYLFIRRHRARFAERLIAELRGVIDETGASPFWDGLAGRFFGMDFREADEFNAIHGHQFIADLMPKHPIYIAMLPDNARAVIGLPHPTGRPAMRMLEHEGFTSQGYLDIFDAGPTMCVATDQVRSIREATDAMITGIDAVGGRTAMLATGRLASFRCGFGQIQEAEGGLLANRECADMLGLQPGDTVLHATR